MRQLCMVRTLRNGNLQNPARSADRGIDHQHIGHVGNHHHGYQIGQWVVGSFLWSVGLTAIGPTVLMMSV